MQFSGPNGLVTAVKENNPSTEFVVAVLDKLGLSLSEFDAGYDAVVSAL